MTATPTTSGLYLAARDQHWLPKGLRLPKDLEPTSMDRVTTRRFLGPYAAASDIVEAVAWFNGDGAPQLIVADLALGRRVIVRFLANSTKITFDRWEAPQ